MFINRYHNIFDSKISEFVIADLVKGDIEEKFNDKLSKLDKEDRFYEIKLQTFKSERLSRLESAEKFEQQKKKAKKRSKLIDFVNRKSEALANQKVKSLIDFDEDYSCSIKSLAIEKNSKINLTTRFLNGKMLMFSKVSIKSFVYDLIDIFMFPTPKILKIYHEYDIDYCYLYQNLTDTDTTSMFFVFLYNLNSCLSEDKARNIIFEVKL